MRPSVVLAPDIADGLHGLNFVSTSHYECDVEPRDFTTLLLRWTDPGGRVSRLDARRSRCIYLHQAIPDARQNTSVATRLETEANINPADIHDDHGFVALGAKYESLSDIRR